LSTVKAVRLSPESTTISPDTDVAVANNVNVRCAVVPATAVGVPEVPFRYIRKTAFPATVNGVAVGDHISVSGNTGVAAYAVAAYVTDANAVRIVIHNPSGGPLTPSNSTYLLRITRPFPVASSVTDFGVTDVMNAGAIPLSS